MGRTIPNIQDDAEFGESPNVCMLCMLCILEVTVATLRGIYIACCYLPAALERL
jgi:hypothetical protein